MIKKADSQKSIRRVKPGEITLTPAMAKELKDLKKHKVDLSDPDAPEITDWSNAVVGKFTIRKK